MYCPIPTPSPTHFPSLSPPTLTIQLMSCSARDLMLTSTDMKFSKEESVFAQVPKGMHDAPVVEDMPMIMNYIAARLREEMHKKSRVSAPLKRAAPVAEPKAKRVVLSEPEEEEGDGHPTRTVVMEDPVSMNECARVPVPWSVTKSTDSISCAVPIHLISTMQEGNAKCSYCKTTIHSGSECVGGSCDQADTHVAHLTCYAFMKFKFPALTCPGELLSTCTREPMCVTRTELEIINAAAMHKLTKSLEMKRALVAKGCNANTNKSRYNATVQMTRRFSELIRIMESMSMPAEAEYTTQSRNVLTAQEETCSCVVCGNSVRTDNSIVACTRHKVHKSCWVYFRLLRDRVGAYKSVDEQKRELQTELKIKYADMNTKDRDRKIATDIGERVIFSACTECPAHLFAHPDCAYAHACE